MTKDIQKALATYLIEAGHEAVCENFGYITFEMDVASLSKSGMLREYEVKVSRSDFLCDKNKGGKNKPKFQLYGNPIKMEWRCPNYFFYVCPDGLIKESEIPAFAGLYYYSPDGKISFIKGAKKIHHIPADKGNVLAKMLRMTAQRKYLGGTMMTYKNNKIKERNRQNALKYNQGTNLERSVATEAKSKIKS